MVDYLKNADAFVRMRLKTSAVTERAPKVKVPLGLMRLCGPYGFLVRPWREYITVAPAEPMLSAVILANAPVRRDAADVRWERLRRRWATKH